MKKVISVDLGGTNIRAALATTDGNLLHTIRKPTNAIEGKKVVIDRIEKTIREAGVDEWESVEEIGVVAPGPLNPYTGILTYSPNLPGWDNVPIKRILQDRLDKSVRVGNDANLAALAEHQFGAGRGLKHLIYITVSTGIGGGIVSHGRLIRGTTGLGAEIGQIVVDMNGPRHSSGVKGSLEYLAAGPAIARQAREKVSIVNNTAIVELAGNVESITAKHVGQAAQAGDPLAIELITNAAQIIGTAIVTLMSIFNPQIVVIGGGVSQTGNIFFDTIREAVKDNLHADYWKNCPIVPVTFGDDVGLLGGVALLNTPDA